MDGQLKKGRRLRSRRERVCRLRNSLVIDAQSPNSSCSDSQRRHSPGRDIASVPDKKHCAAAARAPRRKRRGSSSQEEDIIDGFAIVSFFSLDRLQVRGLRGLSSRRHRLYGAQLGPAPRKKKVSVHVN